MASLTHVCMWQNNGWKNITADEAARLHPGGGVSAHSGLFMCELCGQYVLLTDGNYQRGILGIVLQKKVKIAQNELQLHMFRWYMVFQTMNYLYV
mgnify:CR=1 FL=1